MFPNIREALRVAKALDESGLTRQESNAEFKKLQDDIEAASDEAYAAWLKKHGIEDKASA